MNQKISFKKSVYDVCVHTIESRILSILEAIKDAEEAIHEDTKSSMGDKFESGREMATLEIEKREEALRNMMSIRDEFARINPNTQMDHVEKGALVITNRAIFYIASSLGKIDVDGKPVMVISRQAPIFETLKGFDTAKEITFNSIKYSLLGLE